MQGDPKAAAAGDAHPPFGELRNIESPAGHVAARWWRAAAGDSFETLGESGRNAAAGNRCPRCGRELVETRALIDGPPERGAEK